MKLFLEKTDRLCLQVSHFEIFQGLLCLFDFSSKKILFVGKKNVALGGGGF